jgi:hypothetical protein
LKHVWQEVALVVGGAGRRTTDGGGGRALVLPTEANADVGKKPTTATDVGVDAAVGVGVGEAGRWDKDDTPSGTLEEHYQMELPETLFFLSLWAQITSSAMMMLLLNS